MPEFSYVARSSTGQDVSGTLTAGNKREALAMLSDQALFPMKVTDKSAGVLNWEMRKRVSVKDTSGVLTQLADLLENGVPLMNSLEILADQSVHPTVREVLADVRDKVAEGESLDNAFAAHPEIFSDLTVSIVRAGSEGAFLEDSLKRTAGFLERQAELRGRLVGAMIYPAFLAGAGVLITIILIVFFVPKFESMFEQAKAAGTLPVSTEVLLWLQDVLSTYGIHLLVGLVVGIFWFVTWSRSATGRRLVDRWKLKVPVMGKIFLGAAVSRFCRVLGTLLENGVPLLRSLEISSASTGNKVLSDAVNASAENVSAGDTLAKPLAQSGLIPRSVMAMISVAEESNNLDNVLVNIADTIDRQTARQIDMMLRMVEPVMLMAMGCMVLFIMTALLLPVFEMRSTISD